MDCFRHLEPSISGGDNLVGIGAPGEGFCLGFGVLPDEAVDGGLEVDDRVEDAVFQAAPGRLGKEAFDGVRPWRRCWGKVECLARVTLEQAHHFRCLVRRDMAGQYIERLNLAPKVVDLPRLEGASVLDAHRHPRAAHHLGLPDHPRRQHRGAGAVRCLPSHALGHPPPRSPDHGAGLPGSEQDHAGRGPLLERLNEHREIKAGTTAEARKAYKVETWARKIGITRQVLVDDDLGAFSDLARRMGQAAAETEARILVTLLETGSGNGPTMSNGKTLFHADHGNKAGTGAVISDAMLSAAQLVLRTQKGIEDRTIRVTPALETTAEKWAPCRPLSAAWNRVTRAPLRPRCVSALCLGCGSGFGLAGAGLCHGAFALPEQEPFHVDCDPGHADPGPRPVDADGADEEPIRAFIPAKGCSIADRTFDRAALALS